MLSFPHSAAVQGPHLQRCGHARPRRLWRGGGAVRGAGGWRCRCFLLALLGWCRCCKCWLGDAAAAAALVAAAAPLLTRCRCQGAPLAPRCPASHFAAACWGWWTARCFPCLLFAWNNMPLSSAPFSPLQRAGHGGRRGAARGRQRGPAVPDQVCGGEGDTAGAAVRRLVVFERGGTRALCVAVWAVEGAIRRALR